jgi:hypothetical protein
MRGYVGIPLFGRTYVLTRYNSHATKWKSESVKAKGSVSGPISN